MNQKQKSIYEFKRGDILTRLKPMVDGDGFKDYSLVGTKLTFIGIANACIYLSKKADMFAKMFLGIEISQVKIPIELCENGWSDYIEPDFLDSTDTNDFTNEQEINDEIQKAVEKEDYFKAETLKQKLEEIKKKKGKNSK